MSDFQYEITRNLGVLSESTKGWQKEVNLVSWNQRPVKLDIRDWGPEHQKMGKGVSLSMEEMKKLKEIVDGFDLASDSNVS